MSVIAFEGFESGTATPGTTNDQIRGASGTYSVQSTTKRSGGYALRTNPTGSAVGYVDISGVGANGSGRAYDLGQIGVWIRFYFQVKTLPGSSTGEPFFEVRHASGLKFRLDIKSNGTILNNTTAAVSTFAFSTNTWYRVEIYAQGDDANGSGGTIGYEVMVDGTPVLQDYMNYGNTAVAFIRLGKTANKNGQSVDYYYDDVVIDDAGYPGPGSVVKLTPTGQGATNQFTGGTNSSNYLEVDETPNDGDTTYVASTGANQKQLFTLQSIASAGINSTDRIKGLRVNCHVKKTTATVSDFRVRLEYSSANQETTGTDLSSSAYQEFDLFSNSRPTDLHDWTAADLASLEVGVREVSNTDPVRLSRLCVYADVRDALTPFKGIQSYLGTLMTNATARGFRTFTGVGFRPKVLIFFGWSSTANGRIDGFQPMMGAMARRTGKRFSTSSWRADNVTLSNSNPTNKFISTAPIEVIGASADNPAVKIIEYTDDGFRYLEDKIPTTPAARYFFFLALGGDEIEPDVATFNYPAATGSLAITGMKITPSVVLAYSGETTGSRQTTDITAFNATSVWSAASQGSAGDPSNERSMQKTTKAFLTHNVSAVQEEADITSLDLGGFTINRTTGSQAENWGCIAFENIRSALGSVTEPSSNGTVSVSSLTFRPRAVILASYGFAASGSIQAHAENTIGIAERHSGSITQRCRLVHAKGSVSTSQRDTFLSDSKVLQFANVANNPATIAAEADLSAFSNTGFTLDFTTSDGTQRQILYLALGGIEPPELTTDTITNITDSSATGGGDVTFDGNDTATRGVCWNTTGSPTTADSHTTDGTGTGTFTSSISGLGPTTTYYVRAYATNSLFTSYGSEVSFTTIDADAGTMLLRGVGA